MQVDRPPVDDSELAQALKWSVQELLSAQEEMQVDYFDLPAQTLGANKVNVAAIKKEEINEVCGQLIKIGLFVKAVTIEELAICDLLPKSNDAVIALMQKSGAEISLNIIKEGKLYFNRSFRGYESLSSFSEPELKMGVIDNLSIEIQRSMDFFESQLRQGGVKRILVHLDTPYTDTVVELIKTSMLMEVGQIQLDVPMALDVNIESASCAVLGAALMDSVDVSDKKVAGEKIEEGA
ncbi:MSHA biogenesis protein MshI [Alteromonas sp. a30]|uniref:MSHA biogenesis protein MshI n=1 Tax=Alteromonas sp. a30 TaxID=2730917 RepID=UPI00227E6490|nr:MSHA biogenesis protein MshI [Alteromonas sp. a30]MCY7295280.1 MSHA biogenesis protein MshI [Alteromonas sp. a30]